MNATETQRKENGKRKWKIAMERRAYGNRWARAVRNYSSYLMARRVYPGVLFVWICKYRAYFRKSGKECERARG
jgi:hypothetical protein